LGVLLLLPSQLIAQARKPATISEISTYMGADREQLLYTGAKSEGVVNWYTSLAGDSYKALSRAFEAKYPGVRVEAFRAGGSDLVTRMSEETKARRPTMDALETTYDFMMVSKAYGLTRPYNSPMLVAYPSEFERKGRRRADFLDNFSRVLHGLRFQQGPSSGQCSAERFRRPAPSAA
jgi:hypothetical protein